MSRILSTGGVCIVLGGCAWLPGGMHGCQGACMVAEGHAWLPGGMCGCQGACVVAGGCIGYDKIWSMSGQYASYWNAFLFHDFVGLLKCTSLVSCLVCIVMIPNGTKSLYTFDKNLKTMIPTLMADFIIWLYMLVFRHCFTRSARLRIFNARM